MRKIILCVLLAFICGIVNLSFSMKKGQTLNIELQDKIKIKDLIIDIAKLRESQKYEVSEIDLNESENQDIGRIIINMPEPVVEEEVSVCNPCLNGCEHCTRGCQCCLACSALCVAGTGATISLTALLIGLTSLGITIYKLISF